MPTAMMYESGTSFDGSELRLGSKNKVGTQHPPYPYTQYKHERVKRLCQCFFFAPLSVPPSQALKLGKHHSRYPNPYRYYVSIDQIQILHYRCGDIF